MSNRRNWKWQLQFSLRSMFLIVAISALGAKWLASRYAEQVAIRELQHRGATCCAINRYNGETAYWVFLLDNWSGDDEDLRYVRALGGKVTNVALQNGRITDRALPHLAALQNLRFLSIVECSVTDQGIATLPPLPALRHLRLMDVRVSGNTVRSLVQRHPGLRVSID